MVGAADFGEIMFGLTICGGYEIILRPGKLFFSKTSVFSVKFFLCEFFVWLMYRD